ncbi:hypothetical protein GCM10007094_13160 [Pseudovibrio japonicus]|uniref:HTH cro/C1-type domain-containing protein n=1 Tax=Pseudovibrio japonicus TaxID=366534 RepID=A0ABQ3ECD8_9HYPH|nr:toxin-antitoxin system HicB family antitoxin [Pseudovibrio japonicus]GHB26313.1 hypothetical protein GCM10007094_13160 [Pseudovibrio japonicus]
MAKDTTNSPKGFMLRMPPDLHERIAISAKSSNKSINAEIISRLETSFFSGSLGRLQWLMKQLQSVLGADKFSVSILAEGIEEDAPSRVQRILSGAEEPPFKLLDKIANYCNARADWLKHDIGNPFHVRLAQEYGASLFQELSSEDCSELHFVRDTSREGSVAIIKRLDTHRCETFNTTLHLSDVVGTTGEWHQAEFSNTCRRVWSNKGNIAPYGYLMPEKAFRSLIFGEVHPLIALKEARRSYWLDDWWDLEMIQKRKVEDEYWDGYQALTERVYNYLENNDELRQERDLIG